MSTTNILHASKTLFRKTSPTNNRVCPHWDPGNRSCLLVRDGLYLPIEQHVIAYCLSDQYASCSHYGMLSGEEKEVRNDHESSLNRRRSIRIPHQHPFRFSEIIENDQHPGVREDDAWTIDISEHGVRFATRQRLTTNTMLNFCLEVGETAAKIEGTGRIIWSVPLANTPLFHVGIAFTEQLPSPSSSARYC
jgi:hypothetical protein